MPELPLVLVVEDEYLLQGDLAAALADGGFATIAAYTGEEALTLFMEANTAALSDLLNIRSAPA